MEKIPSLYLQVSKFSQGVNLLEYLDKVQTIRKEGGLTNRNEIDSL